MTPPLQGIAWVLLVWGVAAVVLLAWVVRQHTTTVRRPTRRPPRDRRRYR